MIDGIPDIDVVRNELAELIHKHPDWSNPRSTDGKNCLNWGSTPQGDHGCIIGQWYHDYCDVDVDDLRMMKSDPVNISILRIFDFYDEKLNDNYLNFLRYVQDQADRTGSKWGEIDLDLAWERSQYEQG